MKKLLPFLLMMALCLAVSPASADDPRFVVTAYQRVNVFTGPDITYLLLGHVEAGVPLTIVERNSSGTWVHVQSKRADGTLLVDGWIISGYLNFDLDLHFADVPVNTTLPDADADTDMSQLHDLYVVPVIPSSISSAMRDVYVRGRDELGNYSNVITKVGDSMTADDLYLKPMSFNRIILGPYDYLGDTILYYGASTADNSVAAQIGMTTYTVFDAGWAPNDLCQPRETPLDCEYRRKQPSVAFILFGPNDLLRMDDDHFDQQMRKIVQDTLDHGIIPVLSTFSYDPGMGLWLQSVNFNRRVVAVAADYQVPLINLWLAARALPEYGLEIDHIHMKHWGSYNLKFDHGAVAFSGAALRNLLSIRTLDQIRHDVMFDADEIHVYPIPTTPESTIEPINEPTNESTPEATAAS